MKAVTPPTPGDSSEEIAALIETLHQTSQRLEQLTAGEVDGVVDHQGRMFLLQHAQEQLRASEAAKQAAILDALPAHVALLDPWGTILSVNQGWRQFAEANALLGPAAAIGVNYLEICERAQGEDVATARQSADGIRAVLAGETKSFSLEYPCHAPTQQRWFLMTVTPLAKDSLRGVVVMHLDITLRMKADHLLRDLLEATPDPMVIVDREGRIVLVNFQAIKLFGWRREELLGQSIEVLMPERFRDRHPGERSTFFAQPRARSMGTALELYAMRRDGSEFPVEIGLSPLETAEGTLVISSISDITERKRAEAEIRRLNADLEGRVLARTADLKAANEALTLATAEAEAANLAKSHFLANMSHEIRTPMNGILGMAGILRREGVTPRQAERLATIDQSAQHLLAVINDILDLSKIEAGKFELEEVPIAVSSLMANVSSILSERAKTKGIRLIIESEHLPNNLVGDPTRLQQALLNYATNAIKFTESGSIKLRVCLEKETAEAAVLRFEVEDHGIGIAPEALSRLFTSFEQADNSMTRKYGGTGLGLAITRRLAELMGGKAGAESSPGMGSTFWFSVTLRKAAEAVAKQASEAVDAEALIKQHYAGRRILVVDDEPINLEVAKIQLEAVDLIVDTAKDGAEAIAMVQRASYSAIFMDMQMPKVNGLESTRQIRALPRYQQTPIIAMTANAFVEDRAACFEAGMNDFLIKPFDPETLFATLLRSLDGAINNVSC